MLYLFQKKDIGSDFYSLLFWKLRHVTRLMKESPFLHVFSTIDLNVRESNSWYKIHVSNQSSWAEASMMTIKFLIQLFYLIMLIGLLLALFYLERVILKKGLTDFRLEWMWKNTDRLLILSFADGAPSLLMYNLFRWRKQFPAQIKWSFMVFCSHNWSYSFSVPMLKVRNQTPDAR